VNRTDDHDQLHLPQQPGGEEARAYRGRSEEGLIENTRWAQWSVCRAIRRAIILMQIIDTDSAAGGRER